MADYSDKTASPEHQHAPRPAPAPLTTPAGQEHPHPESWTRLLRQASAGAGAPDPAGTGTSTVLQRQQARLLGDPRLSKPLYAQRRAELFLQLQRTYGNAYARQVVQLMQAQPHRAAAPGQREAGPKEEAPQEGLARQVAADTTLQRSGSAEASAALDVAGEIGRSRGSGQSLDPAARARLEGAMGVDLGNVSIHADSQADTLSRSVQAEAFTTGSDIYFRAGRYDPHSDSGLHLLAHELTHTVQQSKGAVSGTQHSSGVSVSDPSDSFEQEAEQNATHTMARVQRTAATSPAPPTTQVLPVGLQREATHEEEKTVQTMRAVSSSPVQRTTGEGQPGKGPEEEDEIQRLARLSPAPPLLQRQVDSLSIARWADADTTPYPKSKNPDFPETPAGGWNAGAQTVKGTAGGKSSQVERIPIEGLTSVGNQDKDLGTSTKQKTQEDAAGKAIVCIPALLDPKQPIEVLLHLHGHNIGYRERKSNDDVKDSTGTVRDVAFDRIEQQLGASGRNMIAVLPQGTGGSGFGANFAGNAYLDEVWKMLKTMKKLPAGAQRGHVVLSGHSGAGAPLTAMMKSGKLPSDMSEVILFDAINDDGQLDTVKKWVLGKMADDLKAVKDLSTPADQLTYLNTSLRFRGYYTIKWQEQKLDKNKEKLWEDPDTKKKPLMEWKGYGVRYEALGAAIKSWLATNTKGLDATVAKALENNYQVIPANHGDHQMLLGKNDALLKMLGALPPAAAPPTPPPAGSVKTGDASDVGGTSTVPAAEKTALPVQTMRLDRQSTPAAPAPPAVEETEWNAHPNIKARYPSVDAYKAMRAKVVGWGVTPVADYMEATIGQWNASPGMHGYFANNFDGDPHTSYLNLRHLYQARGIPNPGTYFAANIVSITFFGRATEGHKDLKTALDSAQTAMQAAKQTFAPAAGTWSFNPRTFNNDITKLSNHALGKAIDINPDTNPHITDAADFLVIDAVCKTVVPGGVKAVSDYDTLRLANDTFKTNFTDDWIQQQEDTLTTLKTQKPVPPTLAGQKKLVQAIKARKAVLKGYQAKGFLNLPKDLVDALQAAGLSWGGEWHTAKDFMHFELANP